MAATLNTGLYGRINWAYTQLVDTGAVWAVDDSGSVEYSQSLADGTGDSQADLVWARRADLGDTATYSIDLNALSQTVATTDVTFNMANVKAVLVVNHNDASTQTGEDIVLSNDSVSNAHTDLFSGATSGQLVIPAGGMQMVTSKVSEWASGATKKGLKLVNTQANTVTYSIVIVGTSA